MEINSKTARMPLLLGMAMAFVSAPVVRAETATHADSAVSPQMSIRQAPGFQTVRIGDLFVTGIYDGYVPILSSDLHGAGQDFVKAHLAGAFLPDSGDPHTAVNAFVVRRGQDMTLVDTGSGNSLGPNTGRVLENLAAAGIPPDTVKKILITHLHPDHVRGLIRDDGSMAFPNATVYVSKEDMDYWLDPKIAAAATGVQRKIHEWAREALAPYLKQARVHTFRTGEPFLPGVEAIPLHGHTPGHTAYLFDAGNTRLLLWGDTIHSPAVQLADPNVSIAIDSDEKKAVEARTEILRKAVAEHWWIGAAHLPFPGIGHLAANGTTYQWLPVEYAPLDQR